MLAKEFEALNKAIQSAGSILMKYFGNVRLELTHKSGSSDYCTKADVETENVIIEAIEKLFPDYNIIAEECGEKQKDSEYTFVIDPLDGTNNFVLGIPAFTSSVALMKGKEIIYGVINHPVTNDLYYAVKGAGAYLNGESISVNDEGNEENSTLTYFCYYTIPKERMLKAKTKLLSLPIRRTLDLWSPAFSFCSLASGKMEGIINDGVELYDFAAGRLIATEAGAKVTDFVGNEINDDTIDTFLITNGTVIHPFLVNHFGQLFKEK